MEITQTRHPPVVEEIIWVNDMRELVLDKINELRMSPDGWDGHAGMRWGREYLVPDEGLRYFYSKKEKGREAPNAILLQDTTREDFDALGDLELLDCYTKMIRRASRQM